MSNEERPPLSVPPDYVPPTMRREELQEPDGRRLLLYHFDRTGASQSEPPQPEEKPDENKEPTDG